MIGARSRVWTGDLLPGVGETRPSLKSGERHSAPTGPLTHSPASRCVGVRICVQQYNNTYKHTYVVAVNINLFDLFHLLLCGLGNAILLFQSLSQDQDLCVPNRGSGNAIQPIFTKRQSHKEAVGTLS